MTGYTVHTGSTEKFAAGWDGIFGGTGGKTGRKKTVRKKTTATRRTKTTGKKKKRAGAKTKRGK